LSIHRRPRATQPGASVVNFAPVNVGAAFWLQGLTNSIMKPLKLLLILLTTTSGREGATSALFPFLITPRASPPTPVCRFFELFYDTKKKTLHFKNVKVLFTD